MSISQLFTPNEFDLKANSVQVKELNVSQSVTFPAEGNISMDVLQVAELNVSDSAVINNELKVTSGAGLNKVLTCTALDGKTEWKDPSVPSNLNVDELDVTTSSSLADAEANSLSVNSTVKLSLDGSAQAGYLLSAVNTDGDLAWIAPSGGGSSVGSVACYYAGNSSALLLFGFNLLDIGTAVNNTGEFSLPNPFSLTYNGASTKKFICSWNVNVSRYGAGTGTEYSVAVPYKNDVTPLLNQSPSVFKNPTTGVVQTISGQTVVELAQNDYLTFKAYASAGSVFETSYDATYYYSNSISLLSIN